MGSSGLGVRRGELWLFWVEGRDLGFSPGFIIYLCEALGKTLADPGPLFSPKAQDGGSFPKEDTKLASPMGKLKYTQVYRAVIPERQLRAG